MKYFYAVVHKDADSAFGVHFPDLPGCFSAADEIEQLVPNACEALELWFEDATEEVEPRSLDEVRSRAAADLAEGAFIVAVPRIRRSGRQVRANISLDRGMLDAIDRAAADRQLTRSAFLADAARNEIEQRRA
ncbi:MAG: CopG family transcriptional regulator [Novosphingobium sp. 12-64-8]|nr:MAG: CopG family transcriptional regulator [Novosphingobium sp. 12-64-8]